MRPLYAALALVLSSLAALPAWAAGVILDAETNAWFTRLAMPLQSHLPHTQNIHFLLVADPAINAFVDNEKIIHINSGLVLRAKNTDEVRGVVAHEMGHVAGQHLFRMADDKTPLFATLAGAVLGVGTMAAGAPQAGAAMIVGGQAAGVSGLLRHSRQNEMDADNRAIAALQAAGYSVRGMGTLFGKLRTETQLSYGSPPPYLLTHPLPAERLQRIKTAETQEQGKPLNPATDEGFARIQARIFALANPPAHTLRRYPGASAPERYARTIALALQGKTTDARRLMDSLLAEAPRDYFYRATAADLAQDRGDLKTAHDILATLVREDPGQFLLQFQLGDVLKNLDQPAAALPHLEQASEAWPAWPQPWQSLAVVYGQLGHLGESRLALTEYAYQSGDRLAAKSNLALAHNQLKKQPDPKLQNWLDDLDKRIKETD